MEGAHKAEDKVNLVTVVTVGAAGALVVWISIIFLQAYYKNTQNVLEEERAVLGQEVERNALTSKSRADLADYKRHESVVGGIVIPIDRAMELVIEQAPKGGSLVPVIGDHDQPTLTARPPFKPLDTGATPDQPASGGNATP